MHRGHNGELFFDNNLEARVAANRLTTAGLHDVVRAIYPPVEASLSRQEFREKIANERLGGDGRTHLIANRALAEQCIATLRDSIGAASYERRQYIHKMLGGV